MTKLHDLGFQKGIIGETIVSTCDLDGKPNAAPMGIEIKDTDNLFIRPYLSSLTYKNIKATKSAVMNLIFDTQLFYNTAFKEANSDGKLSSNLFETAKTVSAPRLKSAKAIVEVSAKEIRCLGPDRTEFLCKVKHFILQVDVLSFH